MFQYSHFAQLDIIGIEVLKCKEGLNNKAYLLKMDNGLVVFAKLPNPCAGPEFYTTASEVATRVFVSVPLVILLPRSDLNATSYVMYWKFQFLVYLPGLQIGTI